MRRRQWSFAAVGIAAVALLAGRVLAALYVDYRWYESLDAGAIWRARAVDGMLFHGAAALLGGAFAFANLWTFRLSIASLIVPRRIGEEEIPVRIPDRYLLWATIALAVVLGAILTLPQDQWTTLALARDGLPFNESEGYFHEDLGFWTYALPLEMVAFEHFLLALLTVWAIVLFLYVLTASVRWQRGALRVSAHARRHFSVLAALVMIAIAWSLRLDALNALVNGSGAAGLFTWTDHNVTIRADLALAVFAFAASFVVLWGGWTGQLRLAVGATLAVLGASLVARQVVPAIVDHVTQPGQLALRERPYLDTRVQYTRRAFDIDSVPLADSAERYRDVAAAERGVPIWDASAVMHQAEHGVSGGVVEGDVAWRRSSAGPLVEVVRRPVSDDVRRVTGGWTLVRARADLADAHGGLVRAAASGAPADEEPGLLPVYVYAGAPGTLLVSDSAGVLRAPSVDGWGARLAHAWYQQNFRLLFGDLPPAPRIVRRRDLRARIDALVPFFERGDEVTPAVAGDTLFWIVHLYAVSESYPLSRHVRVRGEDWSYARHAAVAVVNSYTGRVTLVATGNDPLTASWTTRFRALFSPWSAVPPEVAAVVPPPSELAYAQADAFARYGARGEMPPNDTIVTGLADTVGADRPAYELDSDGRPMWTIPELDAQGRVRRLLLAVGGASPRLVRAEDAKGQHWGTLLEQVTRVPDSLAASRDARLVRGQLRAFTLGTGAGVLQSSYAVRGDGPPTLLDVHVAGPVGVATGRSLADALGTPVSPTLPELAPAEAATLRTRARMLYDSMRVALRRGDLRAFGEAYDRLGAVLGSAP